MKRIGVLIAFLTIAADRGEARPQSIEEYGYCPSLPYSYDDETNSLFVYGEWLYWIPITQDPLHWGNKTSGIHIAPSGGGGNTILNDLSSQYLTIQYDFSSGYRVGGGVRRAKRIRDETFTPWQIESDFTSFSQSQTTHNSNLGNVVIDDGMITTEIINRIQPNLTALSLVSEVGIYGRSHIFLDFHRLDFELAFPIWFQPNVIFRLKGGPMFAWVKNKWENLWTSDEAQDQTILKWKWWGGGLSGGADIYLPLVFGLAFLVDADVGFLYGTMHQRETYILTGGGDAVLLPPNSNYFATYHFRSFQPEATFSAVLDYMYKFWGNRSFHLSVGWEFTWWFLLNQFGRVSSTQYPTVGSAVDLPTVQNYFDVPPSGLGFQGLKISSGLEF